MIKRILGKAGLHLFRITDAGTYKGPVLDETDKLVRCMNGAERDQFVIGCIQEILSLERLDATNSAEHRNRPVDKTKENLRVVLARFGHDLSHFE